MKNSVKNKLILDLCFFFLVLCIGGVCVIADSPNALISLSLLLSIYMTFVSRHNMKLPMIYVTLFTLIFIIPPLLFFNDGYLGQGALFSAIYLDASQILEMTTVIFLSISCMFATVIFYKPRLISSSQNIIYKFKNYQLFVLFLYATWIISIGFNLIEFNTMISEGYVSIVSGRASVVKTPFFVLNEYFFLALACAGICMRHDISIWLLFIYFFSIMIIGQRLPAFMAMVVILLFYTRFNRLDFRIIQLTTFGLLAPFLMLVAAVRVYGSEALSFFDFEGSYLDLFRVTGFSLDTLKAAVSYEGQFPVNIDPFDKINQIIRVFQARVIDLGLETPSTGFGANFSSQLSIDLFSSGTTFASSGIAEAYFYGGLFLVIIFSILLMIALLESELICNKQSYFAIIFAVICVPKLIGVVRNELFGWFWESLIFILIMSPFILIVNRLFLIKIYWIKER